MAASTPARTDVPAPLRLAEALAPHLSGLRWAIGGSLLAWRWGLDVQPRDLDILLAAADFGPALDRLRVRLHEQRIAPDPFYATRHFARLIDADGTQVDVMADLGVRRAGCVASFAFDPDSIVWRDDLPWMRPADWVRIYELLGRTQQSGKLAEHLRRIQRAVVQPRPVQRDPVARQLRGSKSSKARRNDS